MNETRTVARNRKARHDYEILETVEAGIVLKGAEVKSVREGKVNLRDGFATIEDGEAWLHNVHISPYDPANRWNVDPTRTRKLLLHKGEIDSLYGKAIEKGRTLVPLDVHFRNGVAKVTLAVARGKKRHDKREAIRRREAEREIERELGRR
ncbi:MAG: SsrA-binding protein SmpB [Gemmatimonadota bacterium]|nr:SsrA-binding protein SmpB [Gemmatimonadota bacterium]